MTVIQFSHRNTRKGTEVQDQQESNQVRLLFHTSCPCDLIAVAAFSFRVFPCDSVAKLC